MPTWVESIHGFDNLGFWTHLSVIFFWILIKTARFRWIVCCLDAGQTFRVHHFFLFSTFLRESYGRHLECMTSHPKFDSSVDAYLLEEQSCQISSRSDYTNDKVLGLFWRCRIVGFWHDTVVRLSVRLYIRSSTTLCIVAKRYILHQKFLNKWIEVSRRTRFYNFRPLHRPFALKIPAQKFTTLQFPPLE